MIRPENEIKIYGTGIDLVEISDVVNMVTRDNFEALKEKWFTTEENKYLAKSPDKIIDFATIFSIKEAFIKASCGHATLKDFPSIQVDITRKGLYKVLYKKDEFLKDKYIVIDSVTTNTFIFSTLIIFVNT